MAAMLSCTSGQTVEMRLHRQDLDRAGFRGLSAGKSAREVRVVVCHNRVHVGPAVVDVDHAVLVLVEELIAVRALVPLLFRDGAPRAAMYGGGTSPPQSPPSVRSTLTSATASVVTSTRSPNSCACPPAGRDRRRRDCHQPCSYSPAPVHSIAGNGRGGGAGDSTTTACGMPQGGAPGSWCRAPMRCSIRSFNPDTPPVETGRPRRPVRRGQRPWSVPLTHARRFRTVT